jgi:hypothetical protein
MLNKELVKYNDELYWVYRKVKVEQVADATALKEFWMCDVALRQSEIILFCRHIPNAEIVE